MTRRQARICVVQMLYNLSFHDKEQAQEILNENLLDIKGKVKTFISETFEGIVDNMDAIDTEIEANLVDWNLSRIAKVDLMILRLAVYEINYAKDLPPKVAINEAVEIAQEYSTEKSGKFINGILGNMNKKVSSNG
ncbi:transcription antitermination factor NusB [Candidatus Epulonipiscium viviparus]|uniref:transcription antitermination factor NusB n=1 Tax=Candidatus Epulonipiscium viviparus TaxID=420336 RepID=UPI00016C04B6|nr:transcription antitermination factor NusB [Candidatus Epulopiscium viviparus]